jgi:hypothetical protein
VREEQLGYPRNVVLGSFNVANLDVAAFTQSVRAGRVLGGNGVVVNAELVTADGRRVPPGLETITPPQGARFEVTVKAPPWIPVQEVRVIVNGVEREDLRVRGAMISVPADPLGTTGVTRWTGSFDVAQLTGGRDVWVSFEAGYPILPTADVPDEDGVTDGVYDRLDGDGDGQIDDVEVAAPTESDPRFHAHVVSPGLWPTGFTNPFILDADGAEGWTAPGVTP